MAMQRFHFLSQFFSKEGSLEPFPVLLRILHLKTTTTKKTKLLCHNLHYECRTTHLALKFPGWDLNLTDLCTHQQITYKKTKTKKDSMFVRAGMHA